MRRARIVEAVIVLFFVYVAYRLVAGVWGPIRPNPGVMAHLGFFCLSVFAAGILALDMLSGSPIIRSVLLRARQLSYRLRARRHLAPYVFRIGGREVRVADPVSLAVAPVFTVDIVGGLLLLGSNTLVGLLLVGWGFGFAAYFLYKGFFTPSLLMVSVKGVSSGSASRLGRRVPWYVLLSRLFSRTRYLELLVDRVVGVFTDRFYGLAVSAGLDWGSREARVRLKALFNGSLVVGLALLIPLLAVIGWPGLFTVLSPLAGIGSAFLFLLVKRFDRAKSIEEELPFLALAGLLCSAGGLGIGFAFEKLSGPEFPAVGFEHRVLRRLSRRSDPVSALNRLAGDHPSGAFREFLLGYTSVLLSGGDIVRYLEERVRELFSIQALALRRYAGLASDLIGMAVFVFLFGPLIVLLSSMVSPGSGGLLSVFNLYVVPLVTVLIYVLIHGVQPGYRDRYSDLVGLVLAGVAGGAAALASLLGLAGYLRVAAVVLAATTGYGLYYRIHRSAIAAEERGLTRFIRDLIELRKIGYSMERCLKEIISRGGYDKWFTGVLRDYLAGRITARSWILRVVLRVLRVAVASGSDLPSHLEIINRYVSEYMLSKEAVRSEIRAKELVGYMVPLILSFSIYMVLGLVTRYSSMIVMPGFTIYAAATGLLDPARTTVILVSAALGLLVSKAVDGTARNTLRATISILLALVGLHYAPLLAKMLGLG